MRLLLSAILAYAVSLTVAVCYMLASTPASGQEAQFKQMPIPWYYDYPYRGQLTVIWAEPRDTHKKCGFKTKPDFYQGFAQACTFDNDHDPSRCIVVLPYNNGVYSKDHHAYIMRHENAHCNGWNGKHNN